MIRRNPPLDPVISLDARMERRLPLEAHGPAPLTFRGGVGR
jgi:hypothetical protein